MKSINMTAAFVVGLAGCSGSSGSNDAALPYNDTATGVRLARERVFSVRDPAIRLARMAECAGTLISASQATPPLQPPEFLVEKADRLLRLAVQLGRTQGKTEADVTRIRDEAMAANRQLSQTQPDLYRRYLPRGLASCDHGTLMTEEEFLKVCHVFKSISKKEQNA